MPNLDYVQNLQYLELVFHSSEFISLFRQVNLIFFKSMDLQRWKNVHCSAVETDRGRLSKLILHQISIMQNAFVNKHRS